jgi:tRNA pseudouridine55 synthase
VLDRFRGEIDQVPPMYSALKHQGRPLYELAREGHSVERASRRVTIYTVRLLSRQADSLEIEVACSKGTYIRTLAEDIGEALGCGAHLTALRRLKTGPFEASGGRFEMVTLEALAAGESQEAREAQLLPSDVLVAHLPAFYVEDKVAQRLLHGQQAPAPTPELPVDSAARLYRDRDFLGLVTITATGDIAPRRLIAAPP